MGIGLGLGLAVVAALALNSSYLMQHLGGVSAPAVDVRRPIATVRGLLASRVWLLGTIIGTAGSLLHIAALALAPLSLVGAFSVGGLAILVPVAARLTNTQLSHREIAGTVAVVAALAALTVRETHSAVQLPLHALTAPVLVAIIAAAALVGLRGQRGPAMLGAATGVLYGVADASVRLFSDALKVSLAHALFSPWIEIFVLACGVAFFTFQRGLQTGRAVPVIAVMTTMADVVAVILGVALRGESLGATAGIASLHVFAIAIALTGASLLAMAEERFDGRALRPATA